jgi:hypothetical protein
VELLFTGVGYFVGQLFGGSSRKLEKLFIAALKLRFHFFPEVSKSVFSFLRSRFFFFDSFLIVELPLRLKNKLQTPKLFEHNVFLLFFFVVIVSLRRFYIIILLLM